MAFFYNLKRLTRSFVKSKKFYSDEKRPELKLLKEMLTQSFGAPRNHPKSKPFHDHVLSFFYYDRKIHARHYQISPLLDNDSSRNALDEC